MMQPLYCIIPHSSLKKYLKLFFFVKVYLPPPFVNTISFLVKSNTIANPAGSKLNVSFPVLLSVNFSWPVASASRLLPSLVKVILSEFLCLNIHLCIYPDQS